MRGKVLFIDLLLVLLIHVLIQVSNMLVFVLKNAFDPELILLLNITFPLILFIYFFGTRKVFKLTPGKVIISKLQL